MDSNSNKHIDFKIVEKLGRVIESGFSEGLRESEDDLLQNLIEYRNYKREKARKTPLPSNDIWSSIEEHIEHQETASAPVHKLDNRNNERNHTLRIWLTAAAAVLLVFLGIYYFTNPKAGSQLIAESQAQKFIYTTSDGSKITLRPYSRLYLLHKSTSDMKYKLDGEAYFNVVHNPNRQFIVEVGSGEVRVLGTEFNVSDWGHIVQVYLQRGSVYFQNKKTHKHVILKPGESCTINQKGKLLKPKKQNKSTYLDWLKNVMTFSHQKVSLVFDELEQHYNIIILTNNLSHKFLTETITGQIHLLNLQESLKNLGLVLSGHFQKVGSAKYKFIPIK